MAKVGLYSIYFYRFWGGLVLAPSCNLAHVATYHLNNLHELRPEFHTGNLVSDTSPGEIFYNFEIYRGAVFTAPYLFFFGGGPVEELAMYIAKSNSIGSICAFLIYYSLLWGGAAIITERCDIPAARHQINAASMLRLFHRRRFLANAKILRGRAPRRYFAANEKRIF